MDTAARLLRLLSLLQARPAWTGAELAERLGVTDRTVRRDVARLRSLGYPVEGSPGADGGYGLGRGGRLPPLLLDDDEAVAIAVGLRVAAATALPGAEEAAVAALAKLEQVLPVPLRERVSAVHGATVQLRGPAGPLLDAEVLVTLATGCRRGEGITFRYRSHEGHETRRSVAPLQIVHTGGRWYLVAFDRDRRAWRTFRVDRVAEAALTGHRHSFDDPPDAAALVSEAVSVSPWRIEARVSVEAPVTEVRRLFPPSVAVVEAAGDGQALLRVGAQELGPLAGFVLRIPWPFEVQAPDELRLLLRRWAIDVARRHR